MKRLYILFMLLLPAFGLQAQKVLEGRWQIPAGKSLQLKLDHAEDIQLKGWDKPEVQIKAVVEINGGRYNEALSQKVTKAGESLSVSSVLDKSQIDETSTADCNADHANWQVEGGKNKLILCMNIRYEVWVPRQTAIKLETISGNVTGAGLQGALDLHSISGFIGISLPEAADLWLKSITGELYTDLI